MSYYAWYDENEYEDRLSALYPNLESLMLDYEEYFTADLNGRWETEEFGTIIKIDFVSGKKIQRCLDKFLKRG